jgi:Ni/Fe-hydrogenase subunit HybB-like protein
MTDPGGSISGARPAGQGLGAFLVSELRPRGRWLTPFNLISIPIMLLGAVLIFIRFRDGLGAVTNLDQRFPWGLWIGFDVMAGVALAGGAYVITFAVYVLGFERYRPIVRAALLNGFLAYLFYAGALMLDLGRPWHAFNPFIGNEFGVSSVLFLVAWHFLLYMLAELIEFSPAIAEWLGWRRARKILHGLTLGAVVFGITLSVLHQSGLGALYLMAAGKVHPLWYSEFIPILFFVSSIFAGLSMLIVEGSISHRVFAHRIDGDRSAVHARLIIGLGKGCAMVMFAYLFLQAIVFVHGMRGPYLATPLGTLFLLEVGGLTALPCLLFVLGVRRSSAGWIRAAAVLALTGVILNRLNVSIIAFKWDTPDHYYPTWMEIEVTAAVICAEIWVFRWVVNRLPVLRALDDPEATSGLESRPPLEEGDRAG